MEVQLEQSPSARILKLMDKKLQDETTIKETPSHVYNPRPYQIGLVIGIILFLPVLFLARQHQLTGLQATLFHTVNNLPDGLRLPALWITEGLGMPYGIVLAVLVPIIFRRFRLAWRFLVAIGATGVATEIAKFLVHEPRPAAMLLHDIHARAIETGMDSFPSGHTAMATAMALVLWMILPRAWRWLSVLWILLVALSRVYLGVHSFRDVIGGFAVALIVISILQLLPKVIAKPLRLDNDEPLLKKGI